MRQRGGFSLIELLTVIVILAIGLSGIAILFTGGIVSNVKARRMNLATERAQQEMEKLRSAGFSGAIIDPEVFPAANGYSIVEQNPNRTGTVSFLIPELPEGQGLIEIRYFTGSTGVYPNLKTITVQTTWQGGTNTAGSVSFLTMLANHP